MNAVLVFSITLLIAVLLSGLAGRSVLSLAVIFLLAGFVSGQGVLGWIRVEPQAPVVGQLAELALFAILFSDGMRLNVRELSARWRLPGRALIVGLPLTLLGTALLAHLVAGLSWAEALLVGAILSPTDPVFAAAIIGNDSIPARLRHLLNVESGLNDGLALPLVLVMLALLDRQTVPGVQLAGELVLGVALGVVVPWLACHLERGRAFAVARKYEPFYAFAIGTLVFALALAAHANLYLAAFAAGITIASTRPALRDEFRQFGEILAELLKLAALLAFGALISPAVLAMLPPAGYLFAGLVLLAVRPLAILIAMWGSPLSWRETLTAGWFGPKGFASVIFALLVVQRPVPGAAPLFHLIAVVVATSMVANSSTDVLFARWWRDNPGNVSG